MTPGPPLICQIHVRTTKTRLRPQDTPSPLPGSPRDGGDVVALVMTWTPFESTQPQGLSIPKSRSSMAHSSPARVAAFQCDLSFSFKSLRCKGILFFDNV